MTDMDTKRAVCIRSVSGALVCKDYFANSGIPP